MLSVVYRHGVSRHTDMIRMHAMVSRRTRHSHISRPYYRLLMASYMYEFVISVSEYRGSVQIVDGTQMVP